MTNQLAPEIDAASTTADDEMLHLICGWCLVTACGLKKTSQRVHGCIGSCHHPKCVVCLEFEGTPCDRCRV